MLKCFKFLVETITGGNEAIINVLFSVFLKDLFSNPNFLGSALGAFIASIIPLSFYIYEYRQKIKERKYREHFTYFRHFIKFNKQYISVIEKITSFLTILDQDLENSQMDILYHYVKFGERDSNGEGFENFSVEEYNNLIDNLKNISANMPFEEQIPDNIYPTFLEFQEKEVALFGEINIVKNYTIQFSLLNEDSKNRILNNLRNNFRGLKKAMVELKNYYHQTAPVIIDKKTSLQ